MLCSDVVFWSVFCSARPVLLFTVLFGQNCFVQHFVQCFDKARFVQCLFGKACFVYSSVRQGVFCSSFRSERRVLSDVKFGGARFLWPGVFCSAFCSACSVLFCVLCGRAERLDFCLAFCLDMHLVLFL